MSNDYKQGYRDGFKDGLEEGKKLAPKTQPKLDDYLFGQPGYLGTADTCHVCGRLQSGIQGYVCYSPRCPSMATSYSIGPTGGPVTGAVGSQNEYDSRGSRCPSMTTTHSTGPTVGPVTGAVGAELKPEDYHPDWIGKWGDRDRGR